jgi:hypothetical protein
MPANDDVRACVPPRPLLVLASLPLLAAAPDLAAEPKAAEAGVAAAPIAPNLASPGPGAPPVTSTPAATPPAPDRIATDAPAPASTTSPNPSTATAGEPPWTDRIQLEGLVDAYGSLRFGAGNLLAPNELRAFDLANDSLYVGYAELAMKTKGGPAGFRLALGFSPGADLASFDTPGGAAPAVSNDFKSIQQAFVRVELADKLTLRLGKFRTT